MGEEVWKTDVDAYDIRVRSKKELLVTTIGTKDGAQVTIGEVVITWNGDYIPVAIDELEDLLSIFRDEICLLEDAILYTKYYKLVKEARSKRGEETRLYEL